MNTDQLRAEFEALERKRKGFGEDTLTRAAYEPNDEYLLPLVQARWEGYQAGRVVLQSQDAERLQAAARDMFVRASEIEILYGTNKETEGLVMAAIRLAYLVGPTEQGIDHARRVEDKP